MGQKNVLTVDNRKDVKEWKVRVELCGTSGRGYQRK